MPQPVIEIKNLVKEFRADFWKKKVRILDDVNLSVAKGEVFGFIGPNGAGKTTTLKILMGLVLPTSGTVKLFGESNQLVAVKNKIGFLPENPYFYEYLDTYEFMSFYADLLGMRGKEKEKRIDYLLELVGMSRYRDLQLRKFSKGMLQRVGLAQALINDPELVVLDEPQTGLDPIGRRDVREILLHLKEQGKTVFFSSHIMPDVETICETIGIITRGKIRDVGSIDQLINPKIIYYEVVFRGVQHIDKLSEAEIMQVGSDHIAKLKTDVLLNKFIQTIYKQGGTVVSVTPHKETLEDYFLQQVNLTNKSGV